MQIGHLSALKDLDHEVGIDHADHLSEVSLHFQHTTVSELVRTAWLP